MEKNERGTGFSYKYDDASSTSVAVDTARKAKVVDKVEVHAVTKWFGLEKVMEILRFVGVRPKSKGRDGTSSQPNQYPSLSPFPSISPNLTQLFLFLLEIPCQLKPTPHRWVKVTYEIRTEKVII